jgi:hypothetical protein
VPIIVVARGYPIFFYSNQGDPREPLHVHVRRGEFAVKIWLEPHLRAGCPFGFNSAEVGEIMDLVRQYDAELRRRWDESFGS